MLRGGRSGRTPHPVDRRSLFARSGPLRVPARRAASGKTAKRADRAGEQSPDRDAYVRKPTATRPRPPGFPRIGEELLFCGLGGKCNVIIGLLCHTREWRCARSIGLPCPRPQLLVQCWRRNAVPRDASDRREHFRATGGRAGGRADILADRRRSVRWERRCRRQQCASGVGTRGARRSGQGTLVGAGAPCRMRWAHPVGDGRPTDLARAADAARMRRATCAWPMTSTLPARSRPRSVVVMNAWGEPETRPMIHLPTAGAAASAGTVSAAAGAAAARSATACGPCRADGGPA